MPNRRSKARPEESSSRGRLARGAPVRSVDGRGEGHRVDRCAAAVPGPVPYLEVEVAAGGVAGVADVAEQLAGGDALAGASDGGFAQVHVGQVDGRALEV